MLFRTVVAASAIALLSANLAFAATNATATTKPATTVSASRCTSLEGQFTVAYPKHTKAPFATAAKWWADRGTKLCGEQHFALGERNLIRALKDIGVTAKV
jgi:hypothetical protein